MVCCCDLHIDVQIDILKTFVLLLLCYDSSDYDADDEDDHRTALVAKMAAYTAMEDSHNFFVNEGIMMISNVLACQT
jgi:hypothetical protein